MVSLDDVKDLVLYKRPFYLPIDPKNKKYNSLIMLLTPNYRSSMNVMQSPYTINRRYFESYYIEKSVYRYIKNESVYIPEDDGEYLFEHSPIYDIDSIDPDSITEENINEDARAFDIKYRDDILNKIPNELDFETPIQESSTYNAISVSAIIRNSKGQLLTIVDSNGYLSVPSIFVSASDDKWKELSKYLNSEYEINSEKYAFLYDFNFVYEDKNKNNVIDYDYLYMVKEYSGEVSKGTFMTPGEILANHREKSKILNYFIARYGTKLINRNSMSYIEKKLGASSSNIIFTGYKEDIKQVSPYITDTRMKEMFDNIKEKVPNYPIQIMVSSLPEDVGYIDERNIIVFTPAAFRKAGYTFLYSDYIAYTLQLYSIYVYNPKVLESIAESCAIVLSGILENEFDIEYSTGNFKSKYDRERIIDYILQEYGLDELKYIIKYNKIDRIIKYGLELAAEQKYNITKNIRSLFEADEEPKSDITSLDDISDLGSKIKRKIRSQTVYKLNKIKRDIERGNTGAETRGMTSLSALKHNNVVQSIPTQSANVSQGTEESFKIWSHGDYIMEGNVMYLFEDNINYDLQLRNALYYDRFKTVKDVLEIYKRVKSDINWIKYTYVDISRYSNRNLFFDLSYYNESFFKNVLKMNEEDKMNSQRLMKVYAELIKRLLTDDRFGSYKKKTIFIPVLDWRHNNSMRMWMYREDINPISIIYNMIKTNRNELVKLFGDSDVVFMGGKNYFKINFREVDFSKQPNVMKFVNLIKRIVDLGYNSPADPDPEDASEYSPKGIAMDLIDKVEKSQNVDIDDVSAINTARKSANIITNPTQSFSDDNKEKESNVAVQNKLVDVNTPKNRTTKTVSKKKEDIVTVAKNGDLKTKSATVSVQKTTQNVSTTQAIANTNAKDSSIDRATNAVDAETKKKQVVEKIVKAANTSTDPDDALGKLDEDEFKAMILALNDDTENNVKIDKARASKLAQIEDEFHDSQVAGKSVKDLLANNPNDIKLPETKIPVASINDEWNHMSFVNFDKHYDPDSDIVKMLDSMKDWTFPIAVRNIEVTDNSTSEDVLSLWKIYCEDYKGQKFTLKVDIPRFVEGNFLKLRGNEKVLMIQSTLIPIIKTGLDACQIIGVGGYNKIFVYRDKTTTGKSLPVTNKLIKAVNKYSSLKSSSMTTTYGDNTIICSKYELPMDYIDIAGTIDTIETPNYKFYFNQDEFRLHYQVDDSKGLPIGIQKNVVNNKNRTVSDVIIYYNDTIKKSISTVAGYIADLLCNESDNFREIYNSFATTGMANSYSQISILSSRMPMVVALGYLYGLIPILKRARIDYQFLQELPKEIRYSDEYDYIPFSDGYLVYKVNYSSSLLLSGLKVKCDTENYSIKEINKKQMYLDFLDNFGGTLKSDGLENSYDCMLDPITKEILEIYKLPTDYLGVLLHANNLLADNKYVRHTDQSVRRWRRKELIAGYFYKALSTAYQTYANWNRRTRRAGKMAIKQSAVIDLILSKDPTTNDLSINNVINDLECTHTVTNKGLVGMNTDKAYSIDKRGFDDSMLNVLGMDTGFSGNVGINRQATMDANIVGARGIIKPIDNDTSQMGVTKTLTITEAMTPLGSTHDDPPRSLMTYVQTSKHMVRCENNDPLLITNGADEALPYMCSDIFAFKAKQDGTVVELVQNGKPSGKGDYMVVQYKDGSYDYITLEEQVKKNSDGGYSVPIRLYTELHVGAKFKENTILAYDKLSFSNGSGESGNLAATSGTLAKVAIIQTDEGYEDSAMITESFANKIGTHVIMPKEVIVHKGSVIRVYKKIGDHVREGETIMSYKKDFDEDAANALLKNLSADQDTLSELATTNIKSSYTGVISDIKIYRTCDLDEMSDSLREFVSAYEKEVKKTKAVYKKYGIDPALLPSTTKLDQVGKTKNVDDGVKIVFSIKYTDNMSIGDKISYYSANKGIIKYICPKDQEPYTDFRKDEHIESFMSGSSISSRMTMSIPLSCALNKLLVELDRSVKDIAGIKYDVTKL